MHKVDTETSLREEYEAEAARLGKQIEAMQARMQVDHVVEDSGATTLMKKLTILRKRFEVVKGQLDDALRDVSDRLVFTSNFNNTVSIHSQTHKLNTY